MVKRLNWVFLLAAVVTAVVIVALAAVPPALFMWQDKTLYGAQLQRQRETGGLAPEGEDLYMVRTLYARAKLLRNGGNGYLPAAPDRDALRRQITPALNEMAKAGILPAALSAALGLLAERDDSLEGYYVDGAGFVQAVFNGGGEGMVRTFGIEMEPRTGLVVALWVNSTGNITAHTEGYDPAVAMEAYKSLLGLDSLDDWQDTDTGSNNWRQASVKGQAQLYLLCQGKTLHFGVAVSLA